MSTTITQQVTWRQRLAAASARRARVWPRVRRALVLLLLCVVLSDLITSEGYLGYEGYQTLAIQRAIGGDAFQLGDWEAQAVGQKLHDAVTRPGTSLSPSQQHELVVRYFDAIGRIDLLSWEIQSIYADPHELHPDATAAAKQTELNQLRNEQSQRRSAVEAILQSQVTQVLHDDGLLTVGLVFPPVLFHFTESPDVLILSPRARIEVLRQAEIRPDVTVAQMSAIEKSVQDQLNVSAIVDGTGGFSSYPTMVVEVNDLGWVLSTIAHEWTHTYLWLRPLGMHYDDNGDTRTMNETTATIVGNEVGQQVLARFYPDKLPKPAPAATDAAADKHNEQPTPAPFDYYATMRATRLRVDDLLQQGRVAEAEAYMEAQREVFVSHGYVLRKLNQAYFAFHGSYAVGPAATDPIGDKLRALRQSKPTLLAFVDTVSGLKSVSDLDRALGS